MTAKLYGQMTKIFREKPILLKGLRCSNLFFTAVGFVTYPLLLVLMLVKMDVRGIVYIVIPAVSFIVLTVVRKKINAKRPYELLEIEPLIPKEKKGSSFPSRHVFSIFVIAGCWYGVSLPVGIIVSICGMMLAVIRVIGGIHFPKDVFAGTVIGIGCGLFATFLYNAIL